LAYAIGEVRFTKLILGAFFIDFLRDTGRDADGFNLKVSQNTVTFYKKTCHKMLGETGVFIIQ
jgi:hypothetical protein